MVFLLLSLFTLMIRRLICLPNLLTANGLNSFTKTLVSSPWIDLSFSSFFLMYLHLVLCIDLSCLTCFCLVTFQFCFILLFIKIKIKIEKSEKYKNYVCFVYIGTCLPWIAIETKFSKICIFCNFRWASLCTTKQVNFVSYICDE